MTDIRERVSERPILFSAPMVRAILAGTKTQTRRVVKITHRTPGLAACLEPFDPSLARPKVAAELCPYGVPGDRLWVREAFWHQPAEYEPLMSMTVPIIPAETIYRADVAADVLADEKRRGVPKDMRWKPGMFMPRALSRITIEITDVRVERLREISEEDAMAEGAPPSHPSIDAISREYGYADWPRSWYAQTWDHINGTGSWDANPWVWCLTFRRVQ